MSLFVSMLLKISSTVSGVISATTEPSIGSPFVSSSKSIVPFPSLSISRNTRLISLISDVAMIVFEMNALIWRWNRLCCLSPKIFLLTSNLFLLLALDCYAPYKNGLLMHSVAVGRSAGFLLKHFLMKAMVAGEAPYSCRYS